MMRLRRLLYYLRSIPTLMVGIKNWPTVVAAFLGLPLPKPFTIQLRQSGAHFRVRTPMDVWIVKETCLDRDYERVGGKVEGGWRVIDIGAALGDFTIDAALCHPTSEIHAYEPFPESFELLRENARLNDVANATLFCEAVGPGGEVVLRLAGAAVQHSITSGETTGAIAVPSITLEKALDRLEGHQCDLLKLDCEGAEYEILFAAKGDTLQRVQRVVMEYHDNVTSHNHKELVAFLQQKGFEVSCYPSPVQPDLGLLYAARG